MEGLGQRVRRLRRLRDWSLGTLARASKVPRRVLQQLEMGIPADAECLLRIAKAFDVQVDELVHGTIQLRASALDLTPAREVRSDFETDIKVRIPFDCDREGLRAGDVAVLQLDAIPVDGSIAVIRGPDKRRRLVRVCIQLGAQWYERLDCGDIIMATTQHELVGVVTQLVRALPVG